MILSDSVDLSPARGHSPIRLTSGSLQVSWKAEVSWSARTKTMALTWGVWRRRFSRWDRWGFSLGDGQETIENHRSVEGPWNFMRMFAQNPLEDVRSKESWWWSMLCSKLSQQEWGRWSLDTNRMTKNYVGAAQSHEGKRICTYHEDTRFQDVRSKGKWALFINKLETPSTQIYRNILVADFNQTQTNTLLVGGLEHVFSHILGIIIPID